MLKCVLAHIFILCLSSISIQKVISSSHTPFLKLLVYFLKLHITILLEVLTGKTR